MSDTFSSAQPKLEWPTPIRREDDFSVNLTLDDDPKFWWRVEKTHDDTVLITDFMPGAQDDQTMAATLVNLITEDGTAFPLTVIFHNLVPGALEPAAYRLRLNEVAQSVDRWSCLAAKQIGVSLAETQCQTYRGKARMVVTFE